MLLVQRIFLATALTRFAALGIANSNLRFTPVLVDGSCSSELLTSSDKTASLWSTGSSLVSCGAGSPSLCSLVRTGLEVEFKTGGPITNVKSLVDVLQEEQTESAEEEDADCRYWISVLHLFSSYKDNKDHYHVHDFISVKKKSM